MTLSIRVRNNRPSLDFAAEIPTGELSAMVGPSGSGKTSILRAIAGLLRFQYEDIRFDEHIWSNSDQRIHLPTSDRRVGMVAQNYALFPHLNALGNIKLSLSSFSHEEQERLANHYLEICRMDGMGTRYPHQLSGGQKQRVALARALARRPDVLLLDEPFSAVDKATRSQLYSELRQLHKEIGMTTVLVTHDLNEAQHLASRLFLTSNGRCVQSGLLKDVMKFPCSHEAARVLNIPNVFLGISLHAQPNGEGLLQWGPYVMKVTGDVTRYAESQVLFSVLPQNMFLVPPSSSEKEKSDENRIRVVISDIIELDMEALVWVTPKEMKDTKMLVRVPQRAIARYSLGIGEEVVISILPEDILLLGPN